MLPLSLLSTATGQAMLIELKNGDTYNGKLVGADTWMNVNLEDVICTSRDGDRFWYRRNLHPQLVALVEHMTLARIIRANTDIVAIQADVFHAGAP